MITDLITNTIGLSFIDDNMGNIISALSSGGPKFHILSIARNIAVCLALGIGAYEAYMMMLGRRGMDVMKILRIIIISLCISNSGWIAAGLKAPGKALEREAKGTMTVYNERLKGQEEELKKAQDDMMEKMFTQLDSITKARKAALLAESDAMTGIGKDIEVSMQMVPDWIDNYAKKAAIWLETQACNFMNMVIRWLSELIFQLMYYGILITQLVALNLMTQFLPLAFALSLAPAYKSAWSQFISKFLSVTLWSSICYMMVCYIDMILQYQLMNDTKAVAKITDFSWGALGGLGLDMLGTTVTYAAGMLIGAKMISMSTEIAGWLIPGGVSSGMGGAVAGGAMGAVTGAAAGGASAVMGAATGGITAAVAYGTGFQRNGLTGAFAQTSLGKTITHSRQNADNYRHRKDYPIK